jgi:hypothetical protein
MNDALSTDVPIGQSACSMFRCGYWRISGTELETISSIDAVDL